jgi:hypothetical protein
MPLRFRRRVCAFGTYYSIGFIVLVQLYFAVVPRIGWRAQKPLDRCAPHGHDRGNGEVR